MPAHPLPPPPASLGDPSSAGVIAHAVVAHLAGDARCLAPHDLTERVISAVGSLCVDRNGSRRRAAWTEAATAALSYLRLMPPPEPWTLVGAERPLGGGRADVVWEHPARGILVDEFKTGTSAGRDWAARSADQARRYGRTLQDEHGARALGVRLFVAGNLTASLLVSPQGKVQPLLGSALCPRRLDAEARQ